MQNEGENKGKKVAESKGSVTKNGCLNRVEISKYRRAVRKMRASFSFFGRVRSDRAQVFCTEFTMRAP